MSWAAAIAGSVALTAAAANMIASGRQKKKAKKALEELNANEPKETIPTEVLKNQELAEIRAKTGLPSEQYNMAMKNINRQQAKTIKAATDRHMGLNLLSSIDDNANKAIGNVDVQTAIARMENEKVLMDVNNQVANWKKGLFDRNVRQVWNRKYDYNMGLLGAGNQNQANAINSFANTAGSMSNSEWTSGMFSSKPKTKSYSGVDTSGW